MPTTRAKLSGVAEHADVLLGHCIKKSPAPTEALGFLLFSSISLFYYLKKLLLTEVMPRSVSLEPSAKVMVVLPFVV
jgi:hypothetical protein